MYMYNYDEIDIEKCAGIYLCLLENAINDYAHCCGMGIVNWLVLFFGFLCI